MPEAANLGARRPRRDPIITLYQLQHCPWCAAARQAFANVEQDYEVVEVPRDRAQRREVLDLSGQPLVPTILDGDTVVWDSRRIVKYLYEQYGGEARSRSASELPDDVGGIRTLT